MTDLEPIVNDILREMYDEAEPGLDFDEVLENPDDFDDGWYEEHYLDGERQDEIVEEHCDEHELTDRERMTVTMESILNYGPRQHEERVDNEN